MFKYCLFTLLVAVVAAVQFKDCGHNEVTKLDITGCTGDACVFHKGGATNLTMQFTANQDSKTIAVRVVAKINGLDVPVPSIDVDGCKVVKCPLVKGQTYSFNRNEPVSKVMPNIKTEISAQFTGEHGLLACFTFNAEYKD